MRIPFNRLAACFRGAIRELSEEIQEEMAAPGKNPVERTRHAKCHAKLAPPRLLSPISYLLNSFSFSPYNENEETKGRILPFSLFLAELSLWDITKNLRPVPLVIIGILLFFSLFSWTIVLSKSGIFSRARHRNKNFLRAFRKAKTLQAVAAASEQFGSAPLIAVFEFGYREIERQINQRGALVNKPAVERSLQLGISEEVTKLEMNMPWLATVASVSPFIGLFGTVWGIIDAFEGLGTAGSASLRAVAPGISEALVTTAIGLAAAIPAAIFYNLFGSRIKEFGTRMEDFAIEFQNFAERDFGG
jgi:biopolymer transport protein TolQ